MLLISNATGKTKGRKKERICLYLKSVTEFAFDLVEKKSDNTFFNMSTKTIFPAAVAVFLTALPAVSMTTVVSFWGFTDDYDQSGASRLNFAADVDNSIDQSAQLQAFLGNANELDTNGVGGFAPYTSTVSGITYGPTRLIGGLLSRKR